MYYLVILMGYGVYMPGGKPLKGSSAFLRRPSVPSRANLAETYTALNSFSPSTIDPNPTISPPISATNVVSLGNESEMYFLIRSVSTSGDQSASISPG